MLRFLFILPILVFLSGCASIVEGTDQPLRVKLSPSHATCVVSRDGQQLASVSQHNQSINVGKSKDDLQIECQAAGYLTEHLAVESSASGWGVVGCIFIDLCITDYSTGALNKYPSEITITLTPSTFRTEQEREVWLTTRRNSIETSWDKQIGDLQTQCEMADGDDKEDCRAQVEKMKKKKADALAELKHQRAQTTISTDAPSRDTPSGPVSVESRLKTLKDLRDQKLITEEEYERKRKEIVSSL